MTTTITLTETFSTKLDSACQHVVAARQRVITQMEQGRTADQSVDALLSLADAEGARDVWSKLATVATYHCKSGVEITEAQVMQVVMDLLTRGADDTWSGRGNDVKRAYFDGVRSAATRVGYLFA